MEYIKETNKELKEKLIEMFSWFHDFCVENGLCYYALGGTMLGAKRHEGFIPWDDDIDVGMPRRDYEKLWELLKGKHIGKYVMETPDTKADDYFYPFSKIYDTSTTLIENTRSKIKRGIYIDIFPLDGIGNSVQESKRNYGIIQRKYNLLLTRATGIRKGRSFLKNFFVVLIRFVPEFILNSKKILKQVTDLCKRYEYDSCIWGGNLVGAWRFKEVMKTEIMGEPKLYKFENIMIYGASDADAYLTNLYGNWRKLPPEEKRVTHHDYICCDLHKSYLK